MLSADDVSFSCTPQGALRIDLKDAVFARAEIIFIDPSNRQISALLDGLHVKIGIVPAALADTFMKHASVILTAPHPHGYDLVLSAPVTTLH